MTANDAREPVLDSDPGDKNLPGTPGLGARTPAGHSYPMSEAAGVPWRADGRPVEWAPRPGSIFDGSAGWTPVPGDRGAPPPWVTDVPGAKSGEESESSHRVRALVREVVETSLLAILVFLCVRATFQNFKVDGTSMYPTLENGEFLVVNKLVYAEINVEKVARWVPFMDVGDNPVRHAFSAPKRGDIIVLKHPAHPETDLIKRIIGLPGERVEVRDQKVFIDGSVLNEPYIVAPGGPEELPTLVPEGEYFVMGDNRTASSDSRSFGFAPEELIIGRATVIYWPTSRLGFAPNEAGTVQALFAPAAAATAPYPGARTAVFILELMVVVAVIRWTFRAGTRQFRHDHDRDPAPTH